MDYSKIGNNLFAINVNAVTSAKKFARSASTALVGRKAPARFALVG